MFFVDTIEVAGLGNRSYLAGGEHIGVAVDPPRDIDRVIAAAARRRVRIAYAVEAHAHNGYVTGGLELARLAGASYLVPADAWVSFTRVPVRDGDRVEIDVDAGLTLRALATPGHTPHHTSYVLKENGTAIAVFTGGSLLIGAVGRPDLVEPRLTERLARAQHASAHRLAAEFPDSAAVLPTQGFGSFCSSSQQEGGSTTTGKEKASNEALTRDVDALVADLLAGLDDIPSYYTHMGPVNAAGPTPADLILPAVADAGEIAAWLAAGEWVVDLRNRVAFASGHVAGSFHFEAERPLATYLAWLIPWGSRSRCSLRHRSNSPPCSVSWSASASTARPPQPPAVRATGWATARPRPPSAARRSPTSRTGTRPRVSSSLTYGAPLSAWLATSTARSTSRPTPCTAASARSPRARSGSTAARHARRHRRLPAVRRRP